MVLANIFNFLGKIIEHMEETVREIPTYQELESSHDFKIWLNYFIYTLTLIFKKKKILFLELVISLIILILPTIIVLFASMSSANQLLKIFYPN